MKRRPLLAVLGGVVLLSLSGCVYLRLLKVKTQLQDFEANFTVGGRPSWTLFFKNPVMYDKDAVFLIGSPPLSVSTATSGSVYAWEFQMVRSSTDVPPSPLENLSLRLGMKGRMVETLEAPETFLLYFSRRIVEESFRQAKNAEVLELKKTALATIRLSPEADAERPSLDRTFLLLGPPLSSEKEGDSDVLTYRYAIKNDKKNVPIITKLYFPPDGGLRRVIFHWDTSTVDATFAGE